MAEERTPLLPPVEERAQDEPRKSLKSWLAGWLMYIAVPFFMSLLMIAIVIILFVFIRGSSRAVPTPASFTKPVTFSDSLGSVLTAFRRHN